MKKCVAFTMAAVFSFESPVLAVQPLRTLCDSVGMMPHTAVRTGLGAGSVYLKSSNFKPSTQALLCDNVFFGLTGSDSTAVVDTAFVGKLSGTTDKTGALGISLLGGLIGPSKAKLDASLKNNEIWSVSSGPLKTEGQSALGVMNIAVSGGGSCFEQIRKALGVRKSLKVFVVPQVVRAESIEYSRTTSGGSGAGAAIDIASLVTIGANYKVEKTSANSLKLTHPNINLCWAKPATFTITRDAAVAETLVLSHDQ